MLTYKAILAKVLSVEGVREKLDITDCRFDVTTEPLDMVDIFAWKFGEGHGRDVNNVKDLLMSRYSDRTLKNIDPDYTSNKQYTEMMIQKKKDRMAKENKENEK